MELPHIGDTCTICNRTDYLPFKCNHCAKIVCIDHKNNHGSECPLNLTKFQASESRGLSLKQSCDFCKKITLKLELVLCPQCSNNHCLYHRHQVQHDCVGLRKAKEEAHKETVEKSERQKAALAKLKDSCQSKPQLVMPRHRFDIPTDPKKREMMRRIRCMKIKQSARGPPNVLDEEKIYFEIIFVHNSESPLSDSAKDGNRLKIFTSPKHTVGRMIDWSADELGLKNKNHITGTSHLVFQIPTPQQETTKLDSQYCFSHYLEIGTLASGDEIIISYINEN